MESSLVEYRIRIQKAIDHINRHLAEDLPLDVLADAACFSSFHFHRIFSLMVGETPADFVNRVRLERAANKLLMQSSHSITQVALDCGFSSSATFSRSFKKHFGISATQWREESKKSKTESKMGKAAASREVYIEGVQNILQSHIEGSRTMNVTITQLPTYHIAYAVNMEGYGHEKMDAVWRTICSWGGSHGLFGPDTKIIGISFDNPDITPKDKCRYYACITVPPGTVTPAGIHVMDLPGCAYAVQHFEGKEDGISGAYKELYHQWLPESGYQPANSPCYEIYLSTPDRNPEGLFVMDICLPIIPFLNNAKNDGIESPFQDRRDSNHLQ